MDVGPIRKVLLLFLAAQLLAVSAGVILIQSAFAYPEAFQDFNVAPGGDSGSPFTSALFLLYVLLGAAAMILVLKYYKGQLLFRCLEAAMLFGASTIIFYVFIGWLGVPFAEVFALLAALITSVAKFFNPKMKNAAAVLASAGVGAVFGFSLDLIPALIFVAGLSIYDYVSVFMTKHMVYMARELSGKNLAFSVAATKFEGNRKSDGKPQYSTLELGTGDMVIPAMLAVSAYKLSYSPFDSIVVVFGALTGLFLVLWYVTKKRAFLPALPPISFCAVLALAAFRLAVFAFGVLAK